MIMRFVDKAAAWLVCLFGIAHLAVGYTVFVEPTERRVWFTSAGFLLVLTGLANLAAKAPATRMSNLTAMVGNGSILVIGALLTVSNSNILAQPQTLVLLVLGLILTVQRLRDLRPCGRI
jgi:uncharacterized membrane protein YecN with MAPEG domain